MRLIRVDVVLALLLLLSPIFFSQISDASPDNGVLISEVYPKEEAFSLKNYGNKDVDLKGYIVGDGEGTLEITKSILLSPQEQITIAKENSGNRLDSDAWVITFPSEKIVRKGNFVLADGGDELILSLGSVNIDSVCYGTSNGVIGWNGEPVKLPSGQHIIRKNFQDTDTSDDWISTKNGWTNLLPYEQTFDAMVSPFSFPEDHGTPVMNTLAHANKSIDISIYLVTSKDIISILCQQARNGIKVRMLVEGHPLGVDISSELTLLKTVEKNGGEVRLINYDGAGYTRYSYLHNKYALIDEETVLITSENWTSGNIGDYGNRDWGAVIESKGYADYMKNVFENDFSIDWGDVSDIGTVYPNLKSRNDLTAPELKETNMVFYHSKVTPTVSPDNSFDTIKQFIYSSENRLYVEQMDLGGSLSGTTGETPIMWMSQRSSDGVDTKLILDCSQSDSETHESYLNLIKNTTSIKAIGFYEGTCFDLIHNKGLVSDDSVWIGSVNWTDTSFMRNRESAVIIRSLEVSDSFAALFNKDFGTNIYTVEENGLNLRAETIDTKGGKVVKLTVDGPTGYKYRWLLSDGQTRQTQNCSVLFDAPPKGEYLATVHIEGYDVTETVSILVGEVSQKEPDTVILYALRLAILFPPIGAISYIIRTKNNALKKKNNKKCSYR